MVVWWCSVAQSTGGMPCRGDAGPHRRQPVGCKAPMIPLCCLRKCVETLLQCHDSARKALEFALARPLHQHVGALVHSRCLPGPLRYQDGVKPRFHELVATPPGALPLLIQRAPPTAERRAHSVFHDQTIKDFAIQVDFGKLATLFGTQLIDMQDAFHSFNS